MKGILVVRKYKNRRLYDTERSTHVTRDELLEIVRSGRAIQVQEVGTGEDVTVATLLQLIQSEAGLASSILTPDFLHFLIRSDVGALRRFFREFLPGAMQGFQGSMGGFQAGGGSPWGGGGFGPFGGFPGSGFPNPWAAFQPPQQADSPPASAGSKEVGALRKELEEMREELARMRKRRKR